MPPLPTVIPQNKDEPKTNLTQPELSSIVPSQGIYSSKTDQHLSSACHMPSPEKDTVVRETEAQAVFLAPRSPGASSPLRLRATLHSKYIKGIVPCTEQWFSCYLFTGSMY